MLPPQLEVHHSPITGAFPRLACRADAVQYELAPERVEEFQQRGFLSGIDVLDSAQVAELRRRLEGLGERLTELAPSLYEVEAAWTERPGEVVLHFLGGWLVDEWLHDLVFHPGVTVPMAQLLDTPRPRFLHDQVFWKPPRHPAVVPWHQDYSYWQFSAPVGHATAFLALDDMDAENGATRFAPGSHRWGLLPWPAFGGEARQVEAWLPPHRRAALDAPPITLRAGQMSIHHGCTLHGSSANCTDRPRRGLVLNYIRPDTRATLEGGSIQPGTPPLPRGAVIDGPHFPIAADLNALPDAPPPPASSAPPA